MTLRATKGTVESALELQNQSATVAIPTTPTIFVVPTLITQRGVLSYNTTTGIFTVGGDGVYDSVFSFNVSVSGARTLYFYFEINTGSGFVVNRYSARRLSLLGATDGQVIFSSTNFFPANTQVRAYFWISAAGDLTTTDLPGTPPNTITVPAARIQITGVS